MRFIAYYRVSTVRQGRSGLGLAAQREIVTNWATNNHATQVSEYVETESGRKADRPQLKAAISECLAKGCKLVVAKLDRLARSVAFTEALLDSKVDFVFCDMPKVDRPFIQMAAVFAEYEANLISQRTKAALAQAKKRGVELGNPDLDARNYARKCNAGRKLGSERAAVNKRKRRADWLPYIASIIQPMRDTHSSAEIADELNERGCQTVNGKSFYPLAVTRLLDLLPSVAI